MASTAATCIDLRGTTPKSFQDNASALSIVTTMDDTGVVHFVPNTILQADGSRLSDVPMDRLLSLLLDVCDNIVPGEGVNEDLDLVAALLAANEGGGDATLWDLRMCRMIVGRAFEFLGTSTTASGAPRLGLRCVTLGDSTYLLLSSRIQIIQPTPTHPLSTTTYTLPAAATPPLRTSVLGKHGRGSDTISETDDRENDGRAAHSRTSRLRTDFDIPKQVSRFLCAR